MNTCNKACPLNTLRGCIKDEKGERCPHGLDEPTNVGDWFRSLANRKLAFALADLVVEEITAAFALQGQTFTETEKKALKGIKNADYLMWLNQENKEGETRMFYEKNEEALAYALELINVDLCGMYLGFTESKSKALANELDKKNVVALPCKLGDVVWAIRSYKGIRCPQSGVVSEMYFVDDMRLHIVVKHVARGEWGKTIFASYEEVCKAIEKERDSNEK